jgi:hypothetical protein
MESKQKFLKAKFKDTKKIISYTESFEGFLRAFETTFKIALYPLETSSFSVSYLDDEEDLINIENSFDYQEALKFAENTNQNFLNFLISLKNQSLNTFVFKKDNKENFEFIESNYSLKSFDLQKSPQIEFLIPKGQKSDLNKIQKLEDLKFFVDEDQINFNSKRIKNKNNFRNEDTILSKSPEISIDLPKQISLVLNNKNTKENFEITYDSSNNLNFKEKQKPKKKNFETNEVRNENNFKLEKLQKQKTEKTEKTLITLQDLDKHFAAKGNMDYLSSGPKKKQTEKINNIINNNKNNKDENKENKKEVKKLAKTIVKKAFTEELRNFKKEIEAEVITVVSKHYESLQKKNSEAQKKLTEIHASISKLNDASKELNENAKNAHLGFTCRNCKQTPLLGIRYKCSVCKDYDICEACEAISGQAHLHPFIKIRNQDLNPAFIKTILFEGEDNNIYGNTNNNLFVSNNSDINKNKYVEKFIDLDFNANNNCNDLMNQNNYLNLQANSPMLNYFSSNFAFSNLINNNNIDNNCNNRQNMPKPLEKNSNCTLNNSNFNINNLFKPMNFANYMCNNNNNNIDINTIEEKYKITCLNSSEVLEIKNSKAKEFKITLKLRNTGKNTIPRPCYLECVSSLSEISGKGIPIDLSLKPGMRVNLEVTLDIAGLRKGLYLSVWRMQTSQREFFGEEIPIKIKIEKTEELKIKENFIEKNLNNSFNNNNEKINLNELLKRNKISEIDFPLKKQNDSVNTSKIADLDNLNSSINSDLNSSKQTKIISLEEYKKLKMLKKRNSEKNDSAVKNEKNDNKENKDLFALADEIIKKNPEKKINRKMLINALFRTGGNEKNSIDMATNETHNVCGHYNKHMFN